jgi:lysozyme
MSQVMAIVRLRLPGRLRASLLAAVSGAIVAGIAFGPSIYARIELAPLRYDVIGVDVSHHQGIIDWGKLARGGVSFAFIKASEGEGFHDASFAVNWRGAAQAGIRRGAYHYFTQCRTGADQARNFIARVPRDPMALSPVVDAEQMGACQNGANPLSIVDDIETFLDLLEHHYGRRPIIYTTAEFNDAYLAGRFERERFWIRSLVFPPRFREAQWVFWQYHNRGRRPGVQGPVDLDAFRGSVQDLAAFAGPHR